MHFPKMSRELFMFPASFSLSPNVLVLLHLSEPARSHRENLGDAAVSYFLYKWSFPGAGATVGQQSCPVLILSLDNYLTNYE